MGEIREQVAAAADPAGRKFRGPLKEHADRVCWEERKARNFFDQFQPEMTQVCSDTLHRIIHCLFYAMQPHLKVVLRDKKTWPKRAVDVKEFFAKCSMVKRWRIALFEASGDPSELPEHLQYVWISADAVRPLIIKELTYMQMGNKLRDTPRHAHLPDFKATNRQREQIADDAIMVFQQTLCGYGSETRPDNTELTADIQYTVAHIRQQS